MKDKPVMNDTSVRIPAHAHGILSVEKTRIRLKEKRHAGIGELAGLYIERAEMSKEVIKTLKAHWEHCSLDEDVCRLCQLHRKYKALP